MNPITTKYKAALIAAGALGLLASGATVEHWRMGKKMADYKLTRATALNERAQRAMGEALTAVLGLHGELKAERAKNAAMVKAAVIAAPTAPEFACRDTPLPETYLETFRQ